MEGVWFEAEDCSLTQAVCDPQVGQCVFVECHSDADCADNPNGEHCKLDAVPSSPPQYACVECVDDAHCPQYFYCATGTGQYVCEPMPCYQYQEPDATCQLFDSCYVCNFGSGACEPRYDCATDPCCQGYTCNALDHCERNIDCQTDLDCPLDSICNPDTLQCEYQACCGGCEDGYICNEQTCQCEEGPCQEVMESCNPQAQNCCEGLTCTETGVCFQL